MSSYCEIESVRWLDVGDCFTGAVDKTGFGTRRAEERGWLLTLRGGCECVFVPERMLRRAKGKEGRKR